MVARISLGGCGYLDAEIWSVNQQYNVMLLLMQTFYLVSLPSLARYGTHQLDSGGQNANSKIMNFGSGYH